MICQHLSGAGVCKSLLLYFSWNAETLEIPKLSCVSARLECCSSGKMSEPLKICRQPGLTMFSCQEQLERGKHGTIIPKKRYVPKIR